VIPYGTRVPVAVRCLWHKLLYTSLPFFTFLDGGVCQLLWPVDGHILHYGIISSCASVGAWENGFSVAGYETDWAHSMGP